MRGRIPAYEEAWLYHKLKTEVDVDSLLDWVWGQRDPSGHRDSFLLLPCGCTKLSPAMPSQGFERGVLEESCHGSFFFFFLTDSRSSKSTQDCAWESGRLQHMIQWIPAKRGTWQRPRVHMRIIEGSLLR